MKNVKISVCQFPLKPFASFDAFQAQVETFLERVPRDSDYVVFPELMTLGLFHSFESAAKIRVQDVVHVSTYTEDYLSLFQNLAKKRRQVIIAGSHLTENGGQYYNTCFIFDKDGSYVEHKKTHIFPGESMWHTSEGDELSGYDIGPVKIGVAICYEIEIPEIATILAAQGAEIIFCPSYTFSEAGFWRVRHCAQARAIENQVYVVHCSTVGDPKLPISARGYGRSAIISPCDVGFPDDGIVSEAKAHEAAVITATVDVDRLRHIRKRGDATTSSDRMRRRTLYEAYAPYRK